MNPNPTLTVPLRTPNFMSQVIWGTSSDLSISMWGGCCHTHLSTDPPARGQCVSVWGKKAPECPGGPLCLGILVKGSNETLEKVDRVGGTVPVLGHFNVLLRDAGHVSFRTTPCWKSVQLPISARAVIRTRIQTSRPRPEEFRSGCSCCKRRTLSVKTAVLRCLSYRHLNNSKKPNDEPRERGRKNH